MLQYLAIAFAVILVAAGSMVQMIRNMKDREFKAKTEPCAQEIAERMKTSTGQAEVSRLCSFDGQAIRCPTGFAVCSTIKDNDTTDPSQPAHIISVSLVIYRTESNVVQRNQPLGKVVLEYGPFGLVKIIFNRW